MTTRILLVDDHVMVRQGLRMLLDLEPDFEVVAEADGGSDAIELVSTIHPDIVVMDLAMPELEGLTATRRIHERHPEVRIVILSGDEDETAVVSSVRAGAIGFSSKTASIDVLVQTIRAAARGQVTFSAAVSARLVQELREPTEQPEHLTGREVEVLGHVAQGLSNKEIAWNLRISEKTVKSHVSTILGKLGMESRTQAALHATRTGLVSTDPSGCSGTLRNRERTVIALDSWRHSPLTRVAAAAS
jgi:DNA-binding NarL/FixJ family response regulator